MPLYDYKCREHGIFHDLATLEDHAEPQACPVCGAPSARVIILAPEIVNNSKPSTLAAARNERSAHEPVFSTVEGRQEDLERRSRSRRHGAKCGCHEEPIGKSQVFYTSDGKKVFPTMRPWMISH